MKSKDLVIIGGGSAGMAAAISAFDHGVTDILILERLEALGGILNQCIHNGFGLHEFKEELTGPEFLTRFVNQVEERHIEYKLSSFVSNISPDKVVTYSSAEEGLVQVKAKAIIMAAGCYERNAGAIGIPGDRPSGVVTAGQAQLMLNVYGYMMGKKVFILGSGDIGLIMARRMTLEGAEVLGVAELMPYSNGLNRNIQQCLKDFNIPLYLSHTVTKCIGASRLEAIEISEVDCNLRPIPGTEKRFEVDTLLLSIGLIPNNGLLNDLGIPQSRSRGSFVNQNMETSIEGIFSCGNVLHVHDLVDYVVQEGRVAGEAAARYIKGEIARGASKIKTEAGAGVSYVIPGVIELESSPDTLQFKFRVKAPMKNANIEFALNGNVFKKLFKQAIIPSEMEIVSIPKKLLDNDQGTIVVSAVEKEAK